MTASRAPGAGRKPAGDFAGKSSAFSTRITPDLREALDRESKETGKSVSQIVERRLRESFDEPKQMQRVSAEKHLRALGYVVVNMIGSVERATGKRWDQDPYTFGAIRSALSTFIDWFRPEGDASIPERLEKRWAEMEKRVGAGQSDRSDPSTYGRELGIATLQAVQMIADSRRGYVSLDSDDSVESNILEFAATVLILEGGK